MLETIFCKHYRAMSDHDTCSAGVAYDDDSQVSELRVRKIKAAAGEVPGVTVELVAVSSP